MKQISVNNPYNGTNVRHLKKSAINRIKLKTKSKRIADTLMAHGTQRNPHLGSSHIFIISISDTNKILYEITPYFPYYFISK